MLNIIVWVCMAVTLGISAAIGVIIIKDAMREQE